MAWFSNKYGNFFHVVVALTVIGGTMSQYYADDESEQRPISMRLSDTCVFPSRWSGNWFQSGVASTITINQTAITSKGLCLQALGDKYIVYSQSEECYRCVVFHEKHENVLQYKETFCYPDPSASSLRSLCRRIPGDAHLYSIFRLNADPIPCPFQGSHTFTYSRGHGTCNSPVSTIDTCSHSFQLVLNYQACHDVPGTESKVEEIQCIAQWKEGSSRYMVALLKYLHDPSSYEERFRCYAYESWNDAHVPNAQRYSSRRPPLTNTTVNFLEGGGGDKVIFRVAQSGDATCLGLSPVEGSRTLTLRKGLPFQNSCTFPTWVQTHVQWVTLDGSLSYVFTDKTLRILNNSIALEAVAMVTNLVTSAFCVKDLSPQPASGEASYVLRVTTGCQIGFVCFRPYKRDDHVLELQMSNMGRDPNSVCNSFEFDPSESSFVTLTSPTPSLKECPYIGHFHIMDVTRGRCHDGTKGTMTMGCGDLESLKVNLICPNFENLQEGYRCHGWWEEPTGDTFLIASSDLDGRRYCFQIQEKVIDLDRPLGVKRKAYVTNYDEDDGHVLDRSPKVFRFVQYQDNCVRGRGQRGDLGQSTSASLAFNTSNFSQCEVESSTPVTGPNPNVIFVAGIIVLNFSFSQHFRSF